VRVAQGWTRLLAYYPNTSGTLVFDSDDPTDAATIVNGVSYDELVIDLTNIPGWTQPVNTTVPLEATDSVGAFESDPTPFDVPRLRRGGGMMGGGALVGFGGL
jgi:hypothetical protein